MANGSKLLSGRVVVTPYSDLNNSRHEFLGLSQAEPNLGTGANGSILTISTNNQRVFSNVITVSSNTSTATITNLGVTGNAIINADLTANSLTIGSGIYQFSRTSMFFATTISTATQEILALDAEGLAGVDLVIISTDATDDSRQITKLSIVIYDGAISYNDTSTLAVNNYLCEFSVNYNSTDNEIQISSTPAFANFMDHKMQIVAYNE
jgi:hypothetical protein